MDCSRYIDSLIIMNLLFGKMKLRKSSTYLNTLKFNSVGQIILNALLLDKKIPTLLRKEHLTSAENCLLCEGIQCSSWVGLQDLYECYDNINTSARKSKLYITSIDGGILFEDWRSHLIIAVAQEDRNSELLDKMNLEISLYLEPWKVVIYQYLNCY